MKCQQSPAAFAVDLFTAEPSREQQSAWFRNKAGNQPSVDSFRLLCDFSYMHA